MILRLLFFWGVLDVGPRVYFWEGLHQNRLSNAASEAWMTAGGLAAQQHHRWLWTTRKATRASASALSAAPLAAGPDAKRTDSRAPSTERCPEENTAEPPQAKMMCKKWQAMDRLSGALTVAVRDARMWERFLFSVWF